MDIDTLIAQGNAAVAEWLERCDVAYGLGKPADAKRAVIAAQKELRMIKTEVSAREKRDRADLQEQRAKTSSAGQLIGAFAGSKARGHMGRARAAAKRGITAKQLKANDYYRSVKAALDVAILKLDRIKLDIDAGTYSIDEPDHSPAPLPASTPSSPQWAPDPTGRFVHRYWDGNTWTDHVSTSGVQSVDPMK